MKVPSRGQHRLHNCGKKFFKTHGMTGTSTYRIWLQMMNRCYTNSSHKKFKYYVGRGIKVCDRWHRFENFLEDMGLRPKFKSLDRIDNNGNYEKSNCRWATRFEQARNMRSNVNFTFSGKTQCMKDWAEELGLNYKSLGYRIRNGWPFDLAINKPFK